MRTINTYYKTKQQLQEFINKNKILDDKQVLLQIFTGQCDKLFINQLILDIKSLLPNIKIIGSTTDGEILEGKTSELLTVLSFSIFENTEIKIFKAKNNKSSFQSGKSLIKQFLNIEDIKLAIVFTDGLNTNGEGFLKSFNKFAPNITIAGGLAGDNAIFIGTYVFTQDGIVCDSAVCAVLYNPDLIVNTTYSFGWESIGKELTITNSIENIVYSIDNESPINIYTKYLGSEIGENLPATGIEFPLIINRDGIKIARAVVGKNDDGSLVFAGNISKGDKVHLGYGNIDNIFNDSNKCYGDLQNIPIESIFIYSCMARKRLMGSAIESEMIPLSKIAPVSGFFTYGEFFNFSKENTTNKNKLFNETMTLLTISESSKQNKTKRIQNNNTKNTTTIKALSNLIKVTTQELQELNNSLEIKVKKEVEISLQKDKQLLEQSKLAQMGEMIGNIAHQWRQPLSAISSISSSIQVSNELDILSKEEISKGMEKITEKTLYLSETINTFRDFLKDDKRKEEVILQNKIDKALSIIDATMKDYNIKIINDINYTNLIKIFVITGELPQVIINIINNAKDILIENNIENKWIKISLTKNNNKVIISIEDNGGGVPKNILPKIFEPYFTTKHKSQGTGLGLHMSYNIIKKSMNGNLYVKNTKNGAKFFIELPLS